MQPWPWEGAVQDVFADVLRAVDWEIESLADTAKKSRGVDVLARRGERLLGAEVKGYPSDKYVDPRRAHETKKTKPTTQARHWFSHGILAALMLRDAQPERESLLVFPAFPRYASLHNATRTALRDARVHVVLLRADGTYDCATWTAD
ncbi:hypothetical protein AVL62_04770 [Serinicoccus chungangensis]|uniref:Restriction endonuclease n=1 Tax=Serinicoccus chungangensis TaxID=767452 RepID=A0A0W8I8A8_9MICO|nr:hypothetical protein [Serinicoccus chungangensis]KUG55627.1 hypothetical protein AVL62_04770 [Serinicoccus chungangensis]